MTLGSLFRELVLPRPTDRVVRHKAKIRARLFETNSTVYIEIIQPTRLLNAQLTPALTAETVKHPNATKDREKTGL